MWILYVHINYKLLITMVKFESDKRPKRLNLSNMNSNATDDKNMDSNGDLIFDPSAEMMIQDYDDERTIDEEEAMENNEDPQAELSNLQREGEMPLSELLAMYGYNENENSNSEDLVSNPETCSDNDVRDPLQSDGQGDVMCIEETHETDPVEEEPSELVKLYSDIPGSDPIDDTGGTSRLLRSVSRPQSEEEEDDCDYSPDEEEWKKTIMVGPDYQAKIPVGLCRYDDALPYENDDKMLWDPTRLTEKETEEYLIKAHESFLNNPHIPGGSHVKDDEQALYLLLQCGYNVEEALRRRRINAVPPADTMSIWSEEECGNFETGMRLYGKDFHSIHKNKVRTRSVGELVQFYYLWKKTERHDIYAHKSRLEKKKYSLHPGITDYMDRFLDEQEVGSGHQDRSSSPNLHLLVYSDSKKHNKLEESEQPSPAIDPLGDFVGHFENDAMKSFVKLNANTEIPVVPVDAKEHETPEESERNSTPPVIVLDDDFSGSNKE
ncbi:UNVERIFIED_CONTAM: hypothetical protein PYX00_007075 [Menopon gallinae]|uniref:Mesoderm induction early response protein 1 n=1 Tax=Menopon gallinae TaxID=328185 RepID=A0AAW2HIB9_9NEOP